jgi:predicted RNase H-like HicB family nuclease/predicted RNA binding protein YcfA (HicA-like mRNA interferase family)
MSIEREYEIVLQPEPEGGFSVFVPELPTVATQGETIEEATEIAKEAIEAYLEVMHEDGLPIRPSTAAASLYTRRERQAPGGQGKQVIARPRKGGWYVKRVRGSHHVLRRPSIPDAIPGPAYGSRPLKRGTLASILRAAGVSRDEIAQLLRLATWRRWVGPRRSRAY